MIAKLSSLLILLTAICAIGFIVNGAVSHQLTDSPQELGPLAEAPELSQVVEKVDHYFEKDWQSHNLSPASEEDELIILRRLSLGMMGTIPSLEEIRVFNEDKNPKKIERWLERMLNDPRFHSNLAERLARSYVGVETTPFIIFRRDRFHAWLTEQIRENRPYDLIARSLISGVGVWTGSPEVNFVTQTVNNKEVDKNVLAGRTVRSFLGQRIDCAQCHDHPFAKWKQRDFEGLAAFYGRTQISLAGITEKKYGEYKVEDRKTLEERVVNPAVPYHTEWLIDDQNRRNQLANWVTHKDNRQFDRAIVNRLWALMTGKPWSQGAPYRVAIDDLPDPQDLSDPSKADLLDILGQDFRNHSCDIRRTIRVIAGSRVFRMSSSPRDPHLEKLTDPAERKNYQLELEDHWAVFPLVRLRPEQVVGSMVQASSIKTIDQDSHLLTRMIRFLRERDFINEYGDFGADEFVERTATIPQGLLTMNGKLVGELTKANPFSSVSRISKMSVNDRQLLENCFLVCLSRKPNSVELESLLPQLAEVKGYQRDKWVEDLFWTLFNSPEFSWNH